MHSMIVPSSFKTDSSSPGGNYGKVELKDESYSVMQYMEVEMTSREAISEPKVNALTRPSLLDCLRATALPVVVCWPLSQLQCLLCS